MKDLQCGGGVLQQMRLSGRWGATRAKSVDLLRMVCMDAERHMHTDRCRYRHGHNFHVADGVGPANET